LIWFWAAFIHRSVLKKTRQSGISQHYAIRRFKFWAIHARIYNYRLGLTADWSRVFDSAAELDKAVEIDGYPDRQDLNVDLLRLAKKAGCRISLGTDSHGPTQLGFMEYSAAAALKAGIPRSRILNFMTTEEVTSWVESARSGRSN
jgi:histidinol phosphatase-like PHP family hydrolase